jgi:hypothetical protein
MSDIRSLSLPSTSSTAACPYRDLGADWFLRRHDPERHPHRLAHQIEALAFNVTTTPVGDRLSVTCETLASDAGRGRPLSPPVPPCVCRDSTFSRPSTKSASPSLQAREGSRWGVNGDSDASRSARQQQTSRRSTGSPRAGSGGEASLAGGRLGLTSGDPRQHRRPFQARAGPASRRPRTRAPHGEARSEKTGGRASARTASDRDPSTRWVPWMTASECPRRMPKTSSAGADGGMRAGRREVSTGTN